MEENIPKGENKKIQVLLIFILIIISVGAAIGYTLSTEQEENGPTGPFLTNTYSAISPTDALALINSTNETQLIIVDIRSCKCNYNSGHLPNSTWNVNPLSFYNLTEDLLVYSKNNVDSIEFIEKLLNKTYGDLYYLEGGINAWKLAGYPVET